MPPLFNPTRPRVAVIQDGARLHYAVPKALAQAGMLERMYSEWFITPGSLAQAFADAVETVSRSLGRRLNDRNCPDIPRCRVVNHPLLAVYQNMARRLFCSDESYYSWSSEQVARWISCVGLGRANAVFGFIRNIHPRVCALAKEKGMTVVTDQMIAPSPVEQAHFLQEQIRWPNWELIRAHPNFELVKNVEKQTWAISDHITCASDYVRRGLIDCGVPAERISVLHYPIQAKEFFVPDRRGRAGPIKVGFVGQIGLRKGAPYFLEVARRLAGRGITFKMVGPVAICGPARTELASSTELAGPVPRSTVRTFLAEFDIFLFPSTCEGSAGAVTEAMAAGLPIVTSPNSGTLVEEGTHGFVRNYDDVEGMAEAIDRLAADTSLRQEMSTACRRAAEACNLDAYGNQLRNVFTRLAATRPGNSAELGATSVNNSKKS